MKPPTDWLEQDSSPPLGPRDFEQIRQLAYGTFGLDLKPGKEELVSARLRRLLRKGGFRSFQDYYRHVLADQTGVALAAMVDALATNHTSFMREPDHFTFLREEVLPSLASRDTIEIWCAACSTGEEVWTLAMLLNEAHPQRRISIQASDISNKALGAARAAEYPSDRCEGIPAAWLSRYFVSGSGPSKTYSVHPRIRAQASFRRLNLVENFSLGRLFPVIFCRNVMIYFDRQTQEQVVGRLAAALEPGGYLFVGHAESLTRITHSLEYVRPAVYRKPRKKEIPWSKS
ncbi:MAG: protein-glutamate O-methyltransferase CheR [Ignavibacteriota bacterium]